MLGDNSFPSDTCEKQQRGPISSSRLHPVEELALGLKQKLHLQARSRAAPYQLRRPEPVDLVDRLLQERALVAEAVRRLQALKSSTETATCRPCRVDY